MVGHVFSQFRQAVFSPVPNPRAGDLLSNRFRNDALADPSMQGRTMNSYQPRRLGNRISLHVNIRHHVAHVKQKIAAPELRFERPDRAAKKSTLISQRLETQPRIR
jgi:hypothetical protein